MIKVDGDKVFWVDKDGYDWEVYHCKDCDEYYVPVTKELWESRTSIPARKATKLFLECWKCGCRYIKDELILIYIRDEFRLGYRTHYYLTEEPYSCPECKQTFHDIVLWCNRHPVLPTFGREGKVEWKQEKEWVLDTETHEWKKE